MSVSNLIKGIVICRESGEYLVDIFLDSDINPMLLSSFVGAISLFGANQLGMIRDIRIKGLDIDMIIVHKYSLILIAFLTKVVNITLIREQAEQALEMFYTTYYQEIVETKGVVDLAEYNDFKKIMYIQISKQLDLLVQGKQNNDEDDDQSEDFLLSSSDSIEYNDNAIQRYLTEQDITEQDITPLIKGVVICKQNGAYLTDVVFDASLNTQLLTSFVSALTLFGKEQIDKIKEINIVGLDVDMIMISKLNLILVALVNNQLIGKGLHEEAEMTLELFYSEYKVELGQKNINPDDFNNFKGILKSQIIDFIKKIKSLNFSA